MNGSKDHHIRLKEVIKLDINKYLHDVSLIDSKIANKIYELEMWKEIAEGSGMSDGERVQSSSSQQRMADAIIKYADIERELEVLNTEKKLFINRIEQLQRNHYVILHDLYIKGLTLKESARMNNLKYTNTTTMHSRAKKELKRVIRNECEER